MRTKIIADIILAICIFIIFGCSVQKEVSFILDREQILSEVQEKQLDSLLKVHEKRTTNQIAILTTPDYNGEKDIATYALNYFNRISLGTKRLNNGVLIVLSNANHETRIATGLGTEKVLKDQIVQQIIDSLMVPQFKAGHLFEGLWSGSIAIVNFLDRPENKIREQTK